ncbi:MAG TPA: hypothetical protein VG165_13455 [Solirubrobacteraceae bacterium]|jgi:hypothetical protein|nr:hypothetical protein [Solirubrobacteraceae bacterium]
MPRFRYGLALSACALLVLPAAASARPGQRGFAQTFPHASSLCTNIAAGRGPTALRPDASQVAALCGTLKTTFTTAQGTYFATVTPLKEQAIALVTATREACATRPSTTCKTTRAENKAALKGLRAQVKTAGVTYRTSIEAARKTFWAAVHTLRGGASITPDTGTPLTPSVTLPTTV